MLSCIQATNSIGKANKSAKVNKVKPSKIIGKIGSYDVVKVLGEGADGDVVLVIDGNFIGYAMKLSKIGREEKLNHEIQIY